MRRFGILLCAWTLFAQPPLKFIGRTVSVVAPKTDQSGMFPLGPAKVCLEGEHRQCYTAPKDFGNDVRVSVIQLNSDTSALFVSAASGGTSGWSVNFALLRPEVLPPTAKGLDNLFVGDMTVSNQHQSAWWSEPAISDSKIFLTADYVWGFNESHYTVHRYQISVYLMHSVDAAPSVKSFYLEDRFMTVRSYDYEKDHILESEKSEILARLKRVKQQSPRQ